jgi:hypothetical protein
MAAIYLESEAKTVAEALTATDLDGWSYEATSIGGGQAYISVTDEIGEFVDYLDLHLVASHQDAITRITGNGLVITLS